MEISTSNDIIEKAEDVYRDDDKYAEFIEKKWVAVDDVIKRMEWLKEILSGTVMTKEKDIYYWIDKAFENVIEKH